jgi:hypothetical protein
MMTTFADSFDARFNLQRELEASNRLAGAELADCV